MMESELVVVVSEGGQHHTESGSTGVPQRRKLRVFPSSTGTTGTAPPLHTIAEELNDCSDQSTEPPLASTSPLNLDEPPPYPGPPLTSSTNTSSSQQPQQASPTTLLPTDQPPGSTETVQSSHFRNESTAAAPHSAIELEMQPYPSIEMPPYGVAPSAPVMPQQLMINSEGFAVHPQLQHTHHQAPSSVNTLPKRTTSLEDDSTSMSKRFSASGVYAFHSQVSPLQATAPLHPSSSVPGDLHTHIPALVDTQTVNSPILYSLETGKYYLEISNPQSLLQPFQQNKAEFQHSTSYMQLQQTAGAEHSQNAVRDSTAQLLPHSDLVIEKRRPHSYFYCTVVMIFVFIICLDFLFLLLCLLPAAWYAHKAAEAKYRRAYDEVVKNGNKALCFDVVGGIAHLLFIAAIVTSILLIVHYVAKVF